MNVTRYNFKKAVPLIAQTLRQSDFIAFDFEFSGLQFHKDLANHQTDTQALRYWKYKESIRRFTPTQMGICGFRYFEADERLECYPFNFYIQPYSIEGLLEKQFVVNVNSF